MFSTAFEAEESARAQEQLKEYSLALDSEMEQENERHQRNLEALNRRKDQMVAERKNKLKVSTLICEPIITLPQFNIYVNIL